MDHVRILKYKSSEARIDLSSNSFMAKDANSFGFTSVVEIISLCSKEPNCGHATKLLNIITSIYSDSLIILKAEPMFDTLDDYLHCPDLNSKIKNLVAFYNHRNFVSWNEYIGYNSAEAMVYNNTYGNLLIEFINKQKGE